jgi:hypothetical protein
LESLDVFDSPSQLRVSAGESLRLSAHRSAQTASQCLHMRPCSGHRLTSSRPGVAR